MAIILETVKELRSIPWLRHGFSTRSMGRSTVYGGHSLNLGWTKEDDQANVRENRVEFAQKVANTAGPMRLVTVRQVHSAVVHEAGAPALEGALETSEGKAVLEGDGLVTDIPGLLLAAGTADCVPVLVVDTARRAVGAFHAGWRGTVAAIVERGIDLMRSRYGSLPGDIVAAIGPSIGPCCYTVGEEVREQFNSAFTYGKEIFREGIGAGNGSAALYVDLWQGNYRQLLSAGVSPGHISLIGECTACTRLPNGERKYFSHRAEHGHAGRMLNAIGIVPALGVE